MTPDENKANIERLKKDKAEQRARNIAKVQALKCGINPATGQPLTQDEIDTWNLTCELYAEVKQENIRRDRIAPRARPWRGYPCT